jgi:hypothetical protein
MSHSITDGARLQEAFGGGVADALRAAGDDGDSGPSGRSGSRSRVPFSACGALARQSSMYWRMMSSKLGSGLQAQPRGAPRGGALGPVGHDAGDALVAFEAHTRAHRRAGHGFERVEHLLHRHVERRQVQRRAAAKASRLAS